MSTLTVSLNLEKIHEILAKRYLTDFDKLDDRFYFISGFVTAALSEEIGRVAHIKKEDQ